MPLLMKIAVLLLAWLATAQACSPVADQEPKTTAQLTQLAPIVAKVKILSASPWDERQRQSAVAQVICTVKNAPGTPLASTITITNFGSESLCLNSPPAVGTVSLAFLKAATPGTNPPSYALNYGDQFAGVKPATNDNIASAKAATPQIAKPVATKNSAVC